MPAKIHLLPLTNEEVILIMTAVSAMISAYDSPPFQKTFREDVLQEKKSQARNLVEKLKNVR